MDIRFSLAFLLGKSSLIGIRLLGSGGGALPGLLSKKIDPEILAKLSKGCKKGVVLISGTNGKTTTSRLLASLLKEKYNKVIHNRTGSNMNRGHISAFLQGSNWLSKPVGNLAILEVDEAVLPDTIRQTKPRLLILHNLFRDQLDRYGEVDSIAKKWQAAIRKYLPENSLLLINGDDANLVYLAKTSGHKLTYYYGLDDQGVASSSPTSTLDAYISPASGKPLTYHCYYLSHLGDYYDENSKFTHPPLDFAAQQIKLGGPTSQSQFNFFTNKFRVDYSLILHLPGLYNVYNATAALSAALLLNLKTESLSKDLGKEDSVFGRFERVTIGLRDYFFCLIKNPAGASEVLKTISLDPQPLEFGIFANDNFADGLDVSWYWDSNFEAVAPKISTLICSGKRGADMGLRLKYAGCPIKPAVIPATEEALDTLLSNQKPGQTYILSTYTATLEIQKILKKRSIKSAYWQE